MFGVVRPLSRPSPPLTDLKRRRSNATSDDPPPDGRTQAWRGSYVIWRIESGDERRAATTVSRRYPCPPRLVASRLQDAFGVPVIPVVDHARQHVAVSPAGRTPKKSFTTHSTRSPTPAMSRCVRAAGIASSRSTSTARSRWASAAPRRGRRRRRAWRPRTTTGS